MPTGGGPTVCAVAQHREMGLAGPFCEAGPLTWAFPWEKSHRPDGTSVLLLCPCVSARVLCQEQQTWSVLHKCPPLLLCHQSVADSVHVIMQRDKGKHQLHLELVGGVTEGVTLAHLHTLVVLKSLCWKLLPGSCSTAQSDSSQPRSSQVVCARE